MINIRIIYLTKFIERYKEFKIERARDLFEQVIKTAPKERVKLFYYMYADLEESYGLLNHSMEVYDR